MALYEIRTLITRKRTSLISYGELESDLVANLAARSLLRLGEALEVWRGQSLVYRVGLLQERITREIPKSQSSKEPKRVGRFLVGETAFKR